MTNKIWFITGSSKGFGRVWAEAALARGDQVAATARDPGSLVDLVEIGLPKSQRVAAQFNRILLLERPVKHEVRVRGGPWRRAAEKAALRADSEPSGPDRHVHRRIDGKQVRGVVALAVNEVVENRRGRL